MSKEQELELINNLLLDNNQRIIDNNKKLTENHALILDLKSKKNGKEAIKKLLLQERETLLHYRKHYIKKLLPHIIIPLVLLSGAIGTTAISIEVALSLLALSGLTGLAGVFKFKIKNKNLFNIKQKGLRGIRTALNTIKVENESYEKVIQGIKKNNLELHKKAYILSTTKSELVIQKQRLSHTNGEIRELDIHKHKVKTSDD